MFCTSAAEGGVSECAFRKATSVRGERHLSFLNELGQFDVVLASQRERRLR
jgi:hypothetical protein